MDDNVTLMIKYAREAGFLRGIIEGLLCVISDKGGNVSKVETKAVETTRALLKKVDAGDY